MMKQCDNTSVGMLVWQHDTLLLIERKIFPFGFAPPAGHVDGDDSFETSARRELEEEVGLTAQHMTVLADGRKENRCKREGGDWHHWKIYDVDATGEVVRSQEETKQARFYSREEIAALGARTERYLDGEITDEEWEERPGIEPVWYEWFQELEILPKSD